jgi:carboxyl-terminal processing protease
MRKSDAKILLLVIIVTLLFILGLFVGYKSKRPQYVFLNGPDLSRSGDSSYPTLDMSLFKEVWDKISTDYVDQDIEEQNLIYGSIKGLVEGLDDKYTTFYTPGETIEMQSQNEGKFEGIGVMLRYGGEYTYIESVIDGYPASKADVRAKDIILEVDGEDMLRKRSVYVASKILGEEGTEVEIKVFRESLQEFFTKKIKREVVVFDNISSEILEHDICFLKIYKFTEKSVGSFNNLWDTKIGELTNSSGECRAVILDLRGNPGGYVDSALYISSEFLKKGSVLLNEVDRGGNRVSKTSSRDGLFEDVPVVVLVNSGSASASEIVCGALQDHKRAIVLGEATVGKGFEQKVIPFADGSTLHLVYKKWLTPNNRYVKADSPIVPDIEFVISQEDIQKGFDSQKQEAIKLLKSKIALN